jgi:hypothetical protein
MTTACVPPAARLHDAPGRCLSRTRCRAGFAGPGQSLAGKHSERPLLALTGGGIYFFWQVGVVLALQEQLPSLKACDMVRALLHRPCHALCSRSSSRSHAAPPPQSGASAGALTACLAACDVDLLQSVERAYE